MSPDRSARKGVTLIELLVALVLLGLATALVVPTLRSVPLPGPSGLDEVTDRVRDVAMARGSGLRLRVADDGAWVAVPERGGSALLSGRLDDAAVRELPADDARRELLVDALGRCWPQRRASQRQASTRAFDAVGCRELDP